MSNNINHFNIGDIIVATSKEKAHYRYMYGFVFRTYDSGNIYVIALDKGTFRDNEFRKWKKYGITAGKYLSPNKYNICIVNKAEQYNSHDITQRTIQRKDKQIKYKIITDYTEYLGTFIDEKDRYCKFSYVFVQKRAKNNMIDAGGFSKMVFNPTKMNYETNIVESLSEQEITRDEDNLLNKARYEAEHNLYGQF